MFKKLKNKIQVELEKDHSSTNASICSSMSSSRVDLNHEETTKNQAVDSLTNLANNVEEEKNIGLTQIIQENKIVDENFDKKIFKNENTNIITYQEYSLLKKKYEQSLNDLQKVNEKVLELQNDNKDLKKTNHEINLRNDKLLNKLDELKNNFKQLNEKNISMLESNKNFILKNEEINQSFNSLQENLNNQIKEKINIQNELNKFKINGKVKENTNNEKIISELNDKINRLENIISKKNTIIKLQNQRIHDIKKSVQKGDFLFSDENKQTNSNSNLDNGYSSTYSSSFKLDETTKQIQTGKLNNNKDYATHVNDINFKYLQNVVFKFITSNDYESQKQLVKAISLLLKFNESEESTVRQSIEYKASHTWFKLPGKF